MHINTRFPFKIAQSQPKEGVKTYYQDNFPQDNLSLNASIHNPRVQTLTPPWRMYVPDERCPYYNSNSFQKERGHVETGYKLDYGRTNHKINTKLHKDKNMHTRIRQLVGNDYVDITDPDDGLVTITDGENGFHTAENFNTPRHSNMTYGSLNNSVFYSPNGRQRNDYNNPIRQEDGYYTTALSEKGFIENHNLHRFTDEVTIIDDDDAETEFSNASYKEAMCPLRAAINEGMQRDSPWKKQHSSDADRVSLNASQKPANPEAARREIHEQVDNNANTERYGYQKRYHRDNSDNSDDDDAYKYTHNAPHSAQVHEGFYIGQERLTQDTKTAPTLEHRKEQFSCQCQPYLDEMYTHVLESRASSIVTYLLKDPSFRPWIREWQFLQANINKCNMNFNQLNDDHEDVAYSLDKGKELSFRFRDKDKYMPLSVESYILAHEMAHVANEEIGHGEKFQELMHLIEVAAYMLQYIDLSKYDDRVVRSNGQEILSRRSIKYELIDGINNIIRHSTNSEQKEFWERIKNRVENNR